MPLASLFTARNSDNEVQSYNLLTQASGDPAVRRINALSPIGLPQSIVTTGKLVKATASRAFVVDVVNIYASNRNAGPSPTTAPVENEFGVGITLNMPRVGFTNAQVQKIIEVQHLILMQYLASAEFASADIVAGKVPWTMPNLAYLVTGIR